MMHWSDEFIYAIDVLRFLAMSGEQQRELLFGSAAPHWLKGRTPLRDALEEFSENSRFLIDPDASPQRALADQVTRELDAFADMLLWADDHHPSGRVYTTGPNSLERHEWGLLRRLSGIALDAYGQPRETFSGQWELIFAR